MSRSHAAGVTASVTPSRLVVSRTSTWPAADPTSTQFPPESPLYVALRQFIRYLRKSPCGVRRRKRLGANGIEPTGERRHGLVVGVDVAASGRLNERRAVR